MFGILEHMFAEQSPEAPRRSIQELMDGIAFEGGQIAAAQCAQLLKLAELDARADANFSWDCPSAAHWLSGRCGIDMATASEMLRVARRLVELPAIREAFGAGQLSYPAVRSLVRIATAATEAAMVEMARFATGTQLRRIVDSYRRVLAAHADPKVPHAKRELSYHFDEEGFLCLRGRLAPETGEIFVQALEAVAAELRVETRRCDLQDVAADQPPGRAEIPRAANRADALLAMAESALAGGLCCRAGSERTQVIVHVSAETLAGVGEGDHCEIEDGAEIPPDTARRLACDASVVAVAESATGEVLSVGRRTRKPSAALARALRCRDAGCVFPGCGQRRFVEAHHIVHWASGGETSLDNLVELCWFHHHLIHEGGYGVARDTETRSLVFHRPDGAVIDTVRKVTGPHDGRLSFEVDVADGEQRTNRTPVDYHEIMSFFARHDGRIPKDPPERPPEEDPSQETDPPEDQVT